MKFKRHIKIKEKFVIFFVPFNLLAVVCSCALLYYYSKEAILTRTYDQLTSVRVVKTRQIESFFKDAKESIRLFERVLLNNKKLISKYNADNKLDYIKQQYQLFVQSERNFAGVDIIECSVFDKSQFKTAPNLNSSSNADSIRFLDYSFANISNQPELTAISYEMKEEFDIIVVYTLSIKRINEIMLENNPVEGLGYSGESYILGADSIFRSKSRFIDTSQFRTKANCFRASFAKGKQDASMIAKDYRNIKVLSSYARFNYSGIDWAIIAEIDYDEAFVPINSILVNIIGAAVIISLLMLFLIFYVARKITMPLQVLTDSAKSISMGNVSTPLAITTNDEIGELTEAFNIMNSEINARNIELSREKSERYAHIIDAQENERIKLARDLHDGIGQVFIALKLQLESLSSLSPQDNFTIEKIKKTINTAIEEIRNFSYALIPPALREFGLAPAVTNMVQAISALSGIDITFSSNLTSNIKNDKIEIYLFRIVQELINNIVKHSNASSASVLLREIDDYITLTVSDNGCGFDLDMSKHSDGNGLYGIHERVLALRGQIDMKSSAKGTRVLITIPIKK